jgi:hypothetical protein
VLDVGLSRKRRIHDHAVHQRRGLHRQEIALTDAMPLVTQRLRICWHQLDTGHFTTSCAAGVGDCPLPGARLQHQHAGTHVSQLHQAVNDIWRRREVVEFILRDDDVARQQDLLHPCRCVISENMRLCPAVPLATGCLKHLVCPLVQLAVKLTDQR